jgi:hypothetical protein
MCVAIRDSPSLVAACLLAILVAFHRSSSFMVFFSIFYYSVDFVHFVLVVLWCGY